MQASLLGPLVALFLLSAATVPQRALAQQIPGNAQYFKKLHEVRSERQRGLIREFFAGRRDGVFVDVGSAHYRDLSMTFFLERDFGWSGVAIDALQTWGPGYAEHRPQTRFFAYIVTDHAGTTEPFYRLRGGIGSTAQAERADKLKSEWNAQVNEILVPTITLSDLLDQAGIEKIDFLSIDIEGGEPAALAGFDLERFRPALVGIEVFAENQPQIRAYFEKHGYVRIEAYVERHHGDWFFTCKERSACGAPPATE
jgi:FkbM family methyltransferase